MYVSVYIYIDTYILCVYIYILGTGDFSKSTKPSIYTFLSRNHLPPILKTLCQQSTAINLERAYQIVGKTQYQPTPWDEPRVVRSMASK